MKTIALHQAYMPELRARKAAIEATLAAQGQLALLVTQKEAETGWVEAIAGDAAAIGLDVSQADHDNRDLLMNLLKQELLALQERKRNTDLLSQTLQEAFSLRLAVLYGIDITKERWELDLEGQVLKKVETLSNEGS